MRLKTTLRSLLFIAAHRKSYIAGGKKALLKDWLMYPSKSSVREVSDINFDAKDWHRVETPTTVL